MAPCRGLPISRENGNHSLSSHPPPIHFLRALPHGRRIPEGVLFIKKIFTTKATWSSLQVSRTSAGPYPGENDKNHNAKHCTISGFTAHCKLHDRQGSPSKQRWFQLMLSTVLTETRLLYIALGRPSPFFSQDDRWRATFLLPPHAPPLTEVFPR